MEIKKTLFLSRAEQLKRFQLCRAPAIFCTKHRFQKFFNLANKQNCTQMTRTLPCFKYGEFLLPGQVISLVVKFGNYSKKLESKILELFLHVVRHKSSRYIILVQFLAFLGHIFTLLMHTL